MERVHHNGTMDVLFDDGDRDRGMAEDMVRAIGGRDGADTPTPELREGDRCEMERHGRWVEWSDRSPAATGAAGEAPQILL